MEIIGPDPGFSSRSSHFASELESEAAPATCFNLASVHSHS